MYYHIITGGSFSCPVTDFSTFNAKMAAYTQAVRKKNKSVLDFEQVAWSEIPQSRM